jgi:Pvc16 N-terminal domain
MIDKALQLILAQLNQYVQPVAGADEVVLGNIALNESPEQDEIKNKVVISLVNVEEESTLKNTLTYRKTVSDVKYIEPPVHLNLYLLFSANYPEAYETSLIRLSEVIRFFQSRRIFSIDNAQPLPDTLDPDDPDTKELYLTIELYTLTFEQINHLWGALGGKQMPFVLYKVRLVTMQDRKIIGEGRLIEEVRTDLLGNKEDC